MNATLLHPESRRILIVQFSANRDGSAMSGLMLADGLKAAGWDTHVAFSFEGPIIASYRGSGHQTHVCPHKNWLRSSRLFGSMRNTVGEVRSAGGLIRLIRELAPHVVYVNTSVSLAGALAAYRTRTPCVWHLRELYEDVGGELRAPLGAKWIPRAIFRRLAARVVVNARAVADNVLGGTDAGVVVVPNAVNGSFFDEGRSRTEARQALGLMTEGWILGVPGTLRPMKGHPFFFRAVAPLLRRHPDLRIAVTGDGASSYSRNIETQVETLGLVERVHFLGSVDDMPAFYRACDVACIPSRAEPFGRTVIEAFAVGVPVVATAVGGILETVRDGENGLLVPYGDEEGLSEALEGTLLDAVSRLRRCEGARRDAELRFLATHYQKALRDVVESVARDSSSAQVP